MFGRMWKSAGRPALFVAAGLFVGGVAMPSAEAADLGGDCCADLEERVAELEATTARKGNRRVSLTISGWVNTALMAWDDGINSNVYIVDNGVSRSGFSFDGSARINPNLVAGFQLVIGLATGARSHQTTQFDDDGVVGGAGLTDGTLGVELANWYLDHKQLGQLRVGRLNSASSGTAQVDLGGAGVIANSHFGLWQRGMFLTAGNTLFNNPGSTWNTIVGGPVVALPSLSRQNAVSYTTPTIGGFNAQVAWGEDEFWDAALRYSGEAGGFRFAAAASYSKNIGFLGDANDTAPFNVPADSADLRKWIGSASILHVASGLYVSGAYVNLSYHGTSNGELIEGTATNRPDTTYWYLQGGISKNWTGMGRTVLYGEYGNIEDGAAGLDAAPFGGATILASEADFWGVGIVQHVDVAAMELYLAYRQFRGEITDNLGTLEFNDFNVVMGGARVRF